MCGIAGYCVTSEVDLAKGLLVSKAEHLDVSIGCLLSDMSSDLGERLLSCWLDSSRVND